MKPLRSGFLLVLPVAACLSSAPAFWTPAWGETPSQKCVATIKAATARHRANAVPKDCWRLGPLRLGMSLAQARTLLGAPDASEDITVTNRRRKYPISRLFYVYPRNLRNWLRLAPVSEKNFHPITLRLDFSKEALTAVTVDDTVRTTLASCVPSRAGHGFVRTGGDFPYGFHGLTLGTSLDAAAARFGVFDRADQATDLHTYWPVPLSLEGVGTVSGVRFALSQPFDTGGGIPLFQLKLNPQNCLVTGFAMRAGH